MQALFMAAKCRATFCCLLPVRACQVQAKHPSLNMMSEETTYILYSLYVAVYMYEYIHNTAYENPPAPKVLGRDRPDGTRKRLQVYLGGAFFGQNLLFLIGRDARLQKTL
jgi:hypothetical protein